MALFRVYSTKFHLIAAPEFKNSASEIFKNLEVNIVESSRVLGSVIGSGNACQNYMDQVTTEHTQILQKQSKPAKRRPQNVI